MTILSAADLPAPHTLVDLGEGVIMALMFVWASEDCRLDVIAKENGYEFDFVAWADEEDVLDEDIELYFEKGERQPFIDWQPRVPEGWMLGGKFEHEDGPMAVFLKMVQRS